VPNDSRSRSFLSRSRRTGASNCGAGDYGGARLALLLLALKYLVGDPLVRRFTRLARVARTVSSWLRRFTPETLRPLVRLNQELVLATLARLDVPRLTLDVDGTSGLILTFV
jgi:hypothetical protein